MFGVRSLLIVEKVLMNNDLAIQASTSLFIGRINAYVVTEYGRCVEKKINVTVSHFESSCLLNMFIFS